MTMRLLPMVLTLLSTTLALSSCAGLTKPRDSVKIESDPTGAQILVSGRAAGATPASLDLDEMFPRHWTSRTKADNEGFAFYRRLETLEVKKDGCESYSTQVYEADLMRDIKVTLKCDPHYTPAVAPTTATPIAPPTNPTVGVASGTEQRLKNLDDLKNKGLINDDEYRAQRQRILNEI